MPESDLTLAFPDLQAEVGDYLGFGRTPSAFNDAQNERVNKNIKAGLRMFYFNSQGHPWSFMKPVGSLETVKDQWAYELPPEYSGLTGKVSFSSTSTSYVPLVTTGFVQIRRMRSHNPSVKGIPRYCGDEALPIQTGGQRWQLLLHPTPDKAYTLLYPYQVNPKALTNTKPYPWGGLPHAETIKAACLAAAERDDEEGANGLHQQNFLTLLAASIKYDTQLHRADVIGYNGDGDSVWAQPVRTRLRPDYTVTLNGVAY